MVFSSNDVATCLSACGSTRPQMARWSSCSPWDWLPEAASRRRRVSRPQRGTPVRCRAPLPPGHTRYEGLGCTAGARHVNVASKKQHGGGFVRRAPLLGRWILSGFGTLLTRVWHVKGNRARARSGDQRLPHRLRGRTPLFHGQLAGHQTRTIMKRVIILSVALKDLSDFVFFPGAESFQARYCQQERQYSYFQFDAEMDTFRDAETELKSLGLRYTKHFEVHLDSSELASFPVFNWTIPSLYDLVSEERQPHVNIRALGHLPIAQDFESGLVVADTRIITLLGELDSEIGSRDDRIFSGRRNSHYQVLGDIPDLESPRALLGAQAIKENAGAIQSTFYAEGWDGRSSLSEEGIDFIRARHLAASWLFSYEGTEYRQHAPNYLISGRFADRLAKTFKQSIEYSPITFDNI